MPRSRMTTASIRGLIMTWIISLSTKMALLSGMTSVCLLLRVLTLSSPLNLPLSAIQSMILIWFYKLVLHFPLHSSLVISHYHLTIRVEELAECRILYAKNT